LSALFTWLRKQNRVAANPFEIISKVDTRGKQRSQRRSQAMSHRHKPKARHTVHADRTLPT
jgi:hypothetical protein